MVKIRKNKTFRKKRLSKIKLNKKSRKNITKKIMKGGKPTKLSVKKFERIEHFWNNTGLKISSNCIWYLYINNFPYKLNDKPEDISNYETLVKLIREKGNLPEDATTLPENMYLEFEMD
jgi:hypothetical protein